MPSDGFAKGMGSSSRLRRLPQLVLHHVGFLVTKFVLEDKSVFRFAVLPLESKGFLNFYTVLTASYQVHALVWRQP